MESVPRYANQIYFCYHFIAELIIENINSLLHAGVLGILTITFHLSWLFQSLSGEHYCNMS